MDGEEAELLDAIRIGAIDDESSVSLVAAPPPVAQPLADDAEMADIDQLVVLGDSRAYPQARAALMATCRKSPGEQGSEEGAVLGPRSETQLSAQRSGATNLRGAGCEYGWRHPRQKRCTP